jgi:hypothetical protein
MGFVIHNVCKAHSIYIFSFVLLLGLLHSADEDSMILSNMKNYIPDTAALPRTRQSSALLL